MIGPPPRSPLFPYTTLFRSLMKPRSVTATPALSAAIFLPLGVRRSEEHTSELQSQSNLVCRLLLKFIFFFNDRATTEISTLSLHDALPIFDEAAVGHGHAGLVGRDLLAVGRA